MNHPYADHTWFDFRDRTTAPVLDWPDSRGVTVHLVLGLHAYPLSFKPPFPIPGGLDRPYPDLTNWSQRKVGLREGLDRLLGLFDELDVAATLSIDADALEDLDAFFPQLQHARYSLAAGGSDHATLHAGFSTVEAELAWVSATLERLRAGLPTAIEGWHPPASAHSRHTLDVLARAGLDTVLDFNNDELPFRLRSAAGSLLVVPYSYFSSDLHGLFLCKQNTRDFFSDLSRGIDWLDSESATYGPRLLTVPLHPWIVGTPHRFREFELALRNWHANPRVRFAGLREIKAASRSLS